MTTETTEEGKPLDENLNQGTTEPAEFVEDTDPMIAEMKAAEAEIAAGTGAQPPAEAKTPAENGSPPAPAAAPAPKQPIMVPKARLDEALSKADLYKDQVGYWKGVADAKAAVVKPAEPAPTQGQPADKPADQGAVDEVETAIIAAEEKKLELAERYDNGEISSKQWKQEEILIDKEIRALSAKRLEKVREDSRNEAQAVVSANNFEAVKNNVGLQLQSKHPNVAVIDSLAPAVGESVWKAITDQAVQNLAAQGVVVSKDNHRSQLMLIQERARLTDDLTPFLGYTPARTPPSGQPGPKTLSEAAKNRQAKIELANSQPPAITDMANGANNAEPTEADIENMTEDQMADMLLKAPNLVQRIVGGTQNRGR